MVDQLFPSWRIREEIEKMDQVELDRILADLPLGAGYYFPRLGSTNDRAVELFDSGAADLTLVVAGEQSSGRGRGNRSWFSPPGAGLYFSLVLMPGPDEHGPVYASLVGYSAMGALAVCEPLEQEFELSIDETAALKELNFAPVSYIWVRQTIDNTVAFVESTDESSIVDLVTFYDPVIKHNITLVNNFKEKLQFTDSVQLRLNTIYQNLKVTERPAVLENANLIAWSG
jgi:hypothetical protein